MSKPQQSLVSILGKDIKDRLQGNKTRANARWGLVTPPAGKSKLIWIRAGASRDSVTLAAALMAAIRHKRLDVRLVLTYEDEYPDIIVEHLSGLQKIGFGFGCANSKATETRMLNRLSPFAIIFVGEIAQAGIVSALTENPVPHIINFQTHDVQGLDAEFTLGNSVSASDSENKIEAMSLLVQAQVDTQLGTKLLGAEDKNLFLLAADQGNIREQILKNWRTSELKNSSVLCISPSSYSAKVVDELVTEISRQGMKPIRLSQWDRLRAASIDEIYIIDEWRWFAATAASSLAVHLSNPDQSQYWQSMASATVVSVDEKACLPVKQELPRQTAQEVLAYWQNLTRNTFQCRKMGDDNRKLFWSYRRTAQQAVDDLLQRIFDW